MSSLFIELNQLILPRATNIDDLIFNTTGTMLGLIIYKKPNKKFKLKQKNKIFKNIIINKYKVKNKEYVDNEFLVQDPDGYLLRFTEE